LQSRSQSAQAERAKMALSMSNARMSCSRAAELRRSERKRAAADRAAQLEHLRQVVALQLPRRNPLHSSSSRRPLHLLPPQLAPPATPTAPARPQPAAPSSAKVEFSAITPLLSQDTLLVPSLTTNLSPLPPHVAALCAHAAHVVAALQLCSPRHLLPRTSGHASLRKSIACAEYMLNSRLQAQTAVAFAPVQCPSTGSPDGA
jgi:hypothetical protein